MKRMEYAASAILVFAMSASTMSAKQDWMQFALGPDKTANNTAESEISLSTVTGLTPLFTVPLTDAPDGAPALLTGVTTPTGVRDLVFVQGEHGHLTAFDANTGATVWSQAFTGASINHSSPAIDPNRMFVYVDTNDGKAHKVNVGDGTEVTGGGWPESVGGGKAGSQLTIAVAANGHTYLYCANHGEGHITTIDVNTGAQHVFNASCSQFPDVQSPAGCTSTGARPWGRGMPYIASLDKFFFSTGNNNGNAWNGCTMWKESLLALPADGSTRMAGGCGFPADSWTGTDVVTTVARDQDIGSGGITPLPESLSSKYPHLAVNPGKDARIRIINLDNMSGVGAPGHQGGQIEQLAFSTGSLMRAQSAVWTDPAGHVWVFVVGNSGTHGFTVDVDAAGNPTLNNHWNINNGWTTSAVVANGVLFTAAGGGEHTNTTATHTLQAINPLTGAVVWTAAVGQFHWTSPIVANGIVYMCDGNSGGFGTGLTGNLHAWHLRTVPSDFTIGATPSTESVTPGGSATYTVNVGSVGGFAGTVALSVTGQPAGTAVSFAPASVTGSGTSTLTVATTAATAVGSYTLQIGGASGGTTHSASVTLAVATGASFAISAAPPSATVTAGSGTGYTVTVTPSGGFAGAVALSVAGLPAGASATFTPASVTGSGTSALAVSTTASTPAGTYTLTVTGTSGSLTSTAAVTLTVNSSTGTCRSTAAGKGWTNTPFAAQTGTFTASWDAVPSAAPTNDVMGLSDGVQTANTGFAVIVSFSDTGHILARNGGVYAASPLIAYVAGVSYHFRVAVNITAHTYSVFVTPMGGTEVEIATDFAFRTEQAHVTLLNSVGSNADTTSGTFTYCNFAVN